MLIVLVPNIDTVRQLRLSGHYKEAEQIVQEHLKDKAQEKQDILNSFLKEKAEQRNKESKLQTKLKQESDLCTKPFCNNKRVINKKMCIRCTQYYRVSKRVKEMRNGKWV